MIKDIELEEICKEYGIDYEKLIGKNENILQYGNYNEIRNILEFLIKEINIGAKNIEKSPSILYRSTRKNVQSNWNFLEEHKITISNVENCLHVLSTEYEQLEETYKYIMENYGVRYLNAQTSILRVPKERIQKIENRFKEELKKKNYLQAAYSRFTLEEIEKIVEVCKKNNIEITGSIFLKPAEEIEKIVEVCKKNNIEITGNVFRQPAEEIEKIVEVCKKNDIEITGSVFNKPAEEIEKIVEVCKKNDIEVTGNVFLKSAEEIEKIVEVCKKNNIEITGSIFLKPAEEIEKIVEVCKKNNIEITGNVFRQPAEEIEKIVEVCKKNDIEITGRVFNKPAKEIEEIVEVCKKNNIEITGSVFFRTAEEIEKTVEVCKKNNIEITGSVFLKPAEEIEKIIEVCKKNKIEITGSVFFKTSEEIEKIVEVCKKNDIEITGSVFLKSAEEIEKIVEVCKKNNIEITGSILLKTAKQLEENVEYIRKRFGEEYLKPLIISKNKKNLEEVLPYLEEEGVLKVVIISSSILILKLEEIKERKKYIEQIGETLVKPDGKSFNSIFGWTRKKFKEKILEKENCEKKITGKDIAETTISSLEDIEMLDKESEALQELVEKTKEEEKRIILEILNY